MIEQMLDRLAEYHSQKDSLEARKRALLDEDEVKVPAEIIALQDEASKRTQAYESAMNKAIDAMRADVSAKLAAIVIPAEIKAAYEEIERQRALVTTYQAAKENEYREAARNKRNEIYDETQAETAQVYADIAQRKADIETEFSGDAEAVDANIKALEAEIKAATKAEGQTVKGKYFSAIYVKGRTSWDTEGLNVYADQHPGVVKYRTIGEPSITLRRA
jgi:predicted component of type VI protein secretion system